MLFSYYIIVKGANLYKIFEENTKYSEPSFLFIAKSLLNTVKTHRLMLQHRYIFLNLHYV